MALVVAVPAVPVLQRVLPKQLGLLAAEVKLAPQTPGRTPRSAAVERLRRTAGRMLTLAATDGVALMVRRPSTGDKAVAVVTMIRPKGEEKEEGTTEPTTPSVQPNEERV